MIPQEIQDKIFLLLDYKDLQKTKEIQSDYVKKATKFNSYKDAIEANNFENIKWLYFKNKEWDKLTMTMAVLKDNFRTIKWLYSKGCPYV